MACHCGPHVALEKTLLETVKKAGDRPKCIQCFLGGTTNYSVRKPSDVDIAATSKYLTDHDFRFYVHAPYVINLAREDNPAMVTRGKNCLKDITDLLGKISPTETGTVLHIGAKGTIEAVARHLGEVPLASPLYLENCAGEGTKLGRNWDELRRLGEAIDSSKVGWCIDTCHAHSNGTVDFRESESVLKMFDEIEALGRPTIFHLNDSATAFGSKKDRHAPVGTGTIWDITKPETMDSFRVFASVAKFQNQDIILETPLPGVPEIDLIDE